MGGTRTILLDDAEFSKQRVQSFTSSYQDADANLVVVEECSKCKQIAIECLIFAVPFEVKGNAPFYVVDFVSVLLDDLRVYNQRRAESALRPAFRTQ